MNIHWQVKFCSLRTDTVYTVNIYDDAYDGATPVQLTGEAQPFETQEDKSENMFKPIRNQTGYIRIADTGKDNDGNTFKWSDLMPSSDISNYVELTDSNGAVMWCGYMQASTFSGTLYEQPQVREFPVACMLSVLRAKDFNANSGIMTIAAIINEIFRDVPVKKFWIQNVNVLDWFTKMLDSSLFGDVERDDSTGENIFKSTYNREDVLTELCNFFGLVCRQEGADVFFNIPNEPRYNDYIVVKKEDINDDGTCSDFTVEHRRIVSFLPSFVYADSGEEYLRGIRKATIMADTGKNESIVEFPFKEIVEKYADEPVTTVYHRNNLYCFAKLYTDAAPWKFNNGNIYVTTSGDVNEANGVGGASMNIEEWYNGNLADKHNYDFSANIRVFSSVGTRASITKVSLIALQPNNFQNGVLAINANVNKVRWTENWERIVEQTTDKLICQMVIGIYKGTGSDEHFEGVYWNGTSWQTSPTTFMIPIKDGAIEDNRVLTSNDPAYTGYGAHVDGNVRGGQYRLYIIGIESSSPSNVVTLEITNMSVKFLKNGAKATDDGRNVYTVETGKDFVDTFELDNIIASDNNNAYGKGILLNADGSYCDGVVYGSNGIKERPEENFLNRIKRQGSSVYVMNTINIDDSDKIITPRDVYTFNGKTCYPASIGRMWRDDTAQIALEEIVE